MPCRILPILSLFLVGIAALTAHGTVDSGTFDDFVDQSYGKIARLDPDSIWEAGLEAEYGLDDLAAWTDVSLDHIQEVASLATSALTALHSVDRDTLSADQQVTYDSYEWYLTDRIRAADYPYWDYVIGPSDYGVHNLVLSHLSALPIENEDAARSFVEKLHGIGRWIDQLIDVFTIREASGVIPPRYALDLTLAELDATFPPEGEGGCAPRSVPIYTTYAASLDALSGLSAADRDELLAGAEEAIATCLIPAYRTYRDYVAGLLDRAGDGVGVAGYAGGSEYYDYLLEHHVTKPITAEEVYALGERQVARIQQEMHEVASRDFGWPMTLSMAALEARIVAANQPILEGDALLAEYESYIGEVDAQIDRFFDRRPESGLVFTVDPDAPAAYYVEPPIDRSAPGQIVTDLVNFVPYSTYDEPVLMHHEGIPGHHFQLALARDLDLPMFRRDCLANVYTRHPLFQAYIEGWALYAEHLASEMGVYEDDPIGNLCRLRLELTRAVRLVVDAGLNAFGWTWEQAAQYAETASGRVERTSNLLRYAAYPGQACAYGVGYYTILELRDKAEETLGDAFDIKAFHNVVLGQGAVPLSVLEQRVNDWISSSLAASL